MQAIQWSARVIDGRNGVGLNGAILHTSIGIGIGTVSLEADIIGHWILGALFGIVLTLIMKSTLYP